MRIVVALGGNALLRRGEVPDSATQRNHLYAAARDLAAIAAEHQMLIVHGNGPQVGLLAVESEDDTTLSRPYPLGDLVAESQGLIGSWIQQELLNENCSAVALVTQVVVDGDDPAFDSPSKPIGAVYDEQTAHRLGARHGWTVRPDGSGWRRVVASPHPVDVLELGVADRLVRGGHVVVLGGGGGVPIRRCHGHPPAGLGAGFEPVEAVVDKDLVAALVADRLGADLLVILTDVEGVMTGFGTPEQALLRHITPERLQQLRFPAGSMAPKTTACAQFVLGGQGWRAAIGALTALGAIVAGSAGTQITPHAAAGDNSAA